MSPLVGAVVVAAVLFAASDADAEAPSFQTTVCGRSLTPPSHRTCLRLPPRSETAEILSVSSADPFELRKRPKPSPFYTVAIRDRDSFGVHEWSFLYVPSLNLIRNTTFVGLAGPDSRRPFWRTTPTLITVAFETLRKRLRPFPAPHRWP